MRTVLPVLSLVCAVGALAYNPPTDTVGPLTARIEGAATLDKNTAAGYVAVLENKSDHTVNGTLRVGVIDGWKAALDGNAAFSVQPRSTVRVEFTVTPAANTFAARYPIHLFAEFTENGETLTAHPILIVQTKTGVSAKPAATVAWKTTSVGADSGLALWRLPVFRAIIAPFSKPAKVTAVAWQGSDADSKANLNWNSKVTRGDTREAITMHPPYASGYVGTILGEVAVKLPAQPARLKFANAVRTPDPGQTGDGVTFRVRVAAIDAADGAMGEVLFERHSDSQTWVDGEADLSKYAGRSIRLQLESHPGPKNNTAYDSSYWAEPTLVTGTPRAELSFPPADADAFRTLGQAGAYQVRVWPGRRGLLDAAVGFQQGDTAVFVKGFSVRVAGNALEDWRSPAPFLGASEEASNGRFRMRHRFQDFDLMAEMWMEAGLLKTRFWLENAPDPQPWNVVRIEDAAVGPWSSKVKRVYAGVGNVMEEPAAFRLSFDGHQLATSFVGLDFAAGLSMVQAVDTPPSEFEFDPARGVATIHTAIAPTFSFAPCGDVWAGAKTWRDGNGLRASDGVAQLAGRFVFDLWGGNYAPTAQSLKRAAAYGLVDSAVVWHNWQRWGYDYRLPDIYPANPQYGSTSDFLALARTAKENGMLFAPHDNYIDFYPDAAGFTYDAISFSAAGLPMTAWYNEGRDAQSYRWLTPAFRPYLERNVEAIRDGFAPTGYFIDVWSSAAPFDAWSRDGRFIDRLTTRRAWGEAFAWIRQTLGDAAPQISESGHDQLIGWLDGAQTNHLRVDTPPEGYYSWAVWNIKCKDAERVPWLDAAHHDRFALHGAGYESRYASGLDTALHGIHSDDYITTEALTGHPSMVSEAFSRNVVRKYWLMHDLGRALALRQIEGVEFDNGNPHHQRVRWSGGAEVVVNRGTVDWAYGNHILPPYSFYARVPTDKGIVEAAIERRDGVIVDWSKSPNAWFVNARPPITDRLPIRVTVDSITPAGGRRYTFKYRWEVNAPTPEALRIFVHFVDGEGNILFQGDHNPSPATNTWSGVVFTQSTVTLPDSFAVGASAELRLGFYNPSTGARYLPAGTDDGAKRIRIGTVKLAADGLQWTPLATGPDPVLARMNPELKPIAFDAATTTAAVRLTPAGDALWITQLPQAASSELRLRWSELPWKLPAPKLAHQRDEAGNIVRVVSFEEKDGEIVLRLEAGAFAYELR